MNFYTDCDDYAAELLDVAKLFFTDVILVKDKDIADVRHERHVENNTAYNLCVYGNNEYSSSHVTGGRNKLEEKKINKRYAKLAVYNCLKQAYGSRPWGALTGIRPTRLAYDLGEKEGLDYKVAFRELFDVSPNKIRLVEEILGMQKGYITNDDNEIDIYVNIPFCTSKCVYCSFPSGLIDKMRKYVPAYVECLKKDIEAALETVKESGRILKCVYFGGGTPTSLSVKELSELTRLFTDCGAAEFTVEAGRPDSLSEEMAEMLRADGVTRVSVNPQTFDADTLLRINRRHTPEETVRAFYLAKSKGFTVNMDLIAGLPGESEESFIRSVKMCVELAPENITVHTLALKRGSELREKAASEGSDASVVGMVENAREILHEAGYYAYYMYRQKYVRGNLENVGYTLPGSQCLYNIDMMEERRSVLACGANAISKRIFASQNRIERLADTKDVSLYIERIESSVNDKKKFFRAEKQFT